VEESQTFSGDKIYEHIESKTRHDSQSASTELGVQMAVEIGKQWLVALLTGKFLLVGRVLV
jgi:hypothetical protein